MPRLPTCLSALGTDAFRAALRRDIEALAKHELPLQQGLTRSSSVGSAPHQATILAVDDAGDPLRVRVGVFYSGVIAGCNCADDPSPVDELHEYCEIEARIDRRSGDTEFLLAEGF